MSAADAFSIPFRFTIRRPTRLITNTRVRPITKTSDLSAPPAGGAIGVQPTASKSEYHAIRSPKIWRHAAQHLRERHASRCDSSSPVTGWFSLQLGRSSDSYPMQAAQPLGRTSVSVSSDGRPRRRRGARADFRYADRGRGGGAAARRRAHREAALGRQHGHRRRWRRRRARGRRGGSRCRAPALHGGNPILRSERACRPRGRASASGDGSWPTPLGTPGRALQLSPLPRWRAPVSSRRPRATGAWRNASAEPRKRC